MGPFSWCGLCQLEIKFGAEAKERYTLIMSPSSGTHALWNRWWAGLFMVNLNSSHGTGTVHVQISVLGAVSLHSQPPSWADWMSCEALLPTAGSRGVRRHFVPGILVWKAGCESSVRPILGAGETWLSTKENKARLYYSDSIFIYQALFMGLTGDTVPLGRFFIVDTFDRRDLPTRGSFPPLKEHHSSQTRLPGFWILEGQAQAAPGPWGILSGNLVSWPQNKFASLVCLAVTGCLSIRAPLAPVLQVQFQPSDHSVCSQ